MSRSKEFAMQVGSQVGFVSRWMTKLVACVAVGGLMAAMTPVARADADVSTPKKAGVAFAKAVEAGDQTAVKALATGTDAEFTLVKSISDLSMAMTKLETAAVAKFGAEAKLPKGMAIDMVSDFETADEKIEGDNATLIIKSKPDDKFPPTLKKEGAGWKVDLSNLDKDPQTAAMAMMVPPMVKAFDTVTKNIADGKYKAAADAYMDLGWKAVRQSCLLARGVPGAGSRDAV